MTTRGPWRVTDPAGGPRVRDAAGNVIARVYLRDGYMQVAEMIAAAPAMLEALEAISGAVKNDELAAWEALRDITMIACVAIEKARGRVLPAAAD